MIKSYDEIEPRLEKAIYDLRECTEDEERNSVIGQLIDDLRGEY